MGKVLNNEIRIYHVTKKNRNNISPRVVSHYYGEKGHIRPKCHIGNVKTSNGLMTLKPKSHKTNP